MKYHFAFYFLIIFYMQGFSLYSLTNDSLYWENLTCELKQGVVNDKSLPSNILEFYKGNIKITDDQIIFSLLDTLVADFDNSNKEFRALYFDIFNQICLKSDGALSEVLGHYCLDIVMKFPKYVINYLCGHDDLLFKYSSFLGYEFYFKEFGTSKIKYDFKTFKEILSEECSDLNCFESFFQKIKRSMKSIE